MREHRVIERMVENLRKELGLVKLGELNASSIDSTVDFLRTYADKMHHGKEEDILFRDLAKKNPSVELRKIMDELVQEHIIARNAVKDLFESKERYVKGEKDALATVELNLSKLVELYPMHIGKEDKRFFYPVMNVFSSQEQQEMLKEFYNFDRKINHKNYGGLTEHVRSGASEVNLMKCTVCGYIYDPSKGDPEHGVNANTLWEDLPADWVCPICFAPKTMFEKYGI